MSVIVFNYSNHLFKYRFTISKNTGTSTIFLPLVVFSDGESLAFNPNDGLLYRLSGDDKFESIDPDTNLVTTIPLLSNEISEPTALTHLSGNVLYAASFDDLYTLTTSGGVSFVSKLDHGSKGLALDCEVPLIVRPIPTLSEWGLIAIAVILGIVGFMVMRRRKVAG